MYVSIVNGFWKTDKVTLNANNCYESLKWTCLYKISIFVVWFYLKTFSVAVFRDFKTLKSSFGI